MRRWAAVLALVAGCNDDLARPELIAGLRILGIQSEPADGEVGTEVATAALAVTPDPATAVERAWLACVTSATSLDSAPCLDLATQGAPPACAADPEADFCFLGSGETATYRLPARALDGRGAQESGQVFLILLAAETAGGGLVACQGLVGGELPDFCRVAVKRVAVLRAGAARNANPRMTGLSVEGARLAVGLAEGAAEGDEALFLSWFVTAGELESFRTDGDAAGLVNEWTPADQPGTAFVVLRDGRGGESWASARR